MKSMNVKENIQTNISSIKRRKVIKNKEVKSLQKKKINLKVIKRTQKSLEVRQMTGMEKIMNIIILMMKFIMLRDIIVINQERTDTREEKLGLNRPKPEEPVATARPRYHNVVVILLEKVYWLEEVRPWPAPLGDSLADDQGLLALGCYQPAIGLVDINRRIHVWNTRRDDRHGVLPVVVVHGGVPSWVGLFPNLLDVDWLRPVPLDKGVEKPVDHVCATATAALVSCHLADFGHQDGPGSSTQETKHIAINAILPGPELDDSQSQSKLLNAGN